MSAILRYNGDTIRIVADKNTVTLVRSTREVPFSSMPPQSGGWVALDETKEKFTEYLVIVAGSYRTFTVSQQDFENIESLLMLNR